MTNTRKRKKTSTSCSVCGDHFTNESDLLQHMKKSPRCQSNVVKCVACHKEFSSDTKLYGHLKHYSSKNCLILHNEHQNKSHNSSVMAVRPQMSDLFPVHQQEPNFSAQELIGRNYLIGIGNDFLSGEIGITDCNRPEFQETIHNALEACNPLAKDVQPASSTINTQTSNNHNTTPLDSIETANTSVDNDNPITDPYSEFGYHSDEDNEMNDDMDTDDDERHEDYEEDGLGEMILCRPTNPPIAENPIVPTDVAQTRVQGRPTNPPLTETPTVPINVAQPIVPRRFKDYEIKATDLLDRQKTISNVRTNIRVDKNTIACLKLQNILHRSNCPMSVYDKVMEWAQTYKQDLFTNTSNPSHSQLVELCSKKLFGGGKKGDSHKVLGMYPSTQHIKLPTNREVDVTTFSFRKMVCHMLSDDDLMKWDNLIYQKLGENSFHVDTNPNQDLGEINTGKWFQKTYEEFIESNPIGPNGRRRILCPIIFYIDGLSLDAYGKLTLEPLTFTLGLFKRKLRNLAAFWRTLGFMEDLDSLYGANLQSALDKANDYHTILACILEEFKQVQELKCPMPFDLMIEGELHQVDLIFEVAYVIGDCKGLDMLAGRKMSHATASLTRFCDCQKDDGDNPDIICKILKYDELKTMSDERLEQLAFRKLSPCNAFDGISWGSNKRGIIGATPTDLLHTILKDGPVGSAIKSIRTEMPKLGLHEMDRTAAKIAVTCSRQSDKEFPSINPFRNGLSKVNKLTADEIYAKTFMYFLVFNHKPFSNFLINKHFHLGPKDTSKKKQWTETDYGKAHRGLEIVLCFYQWVSKEDHPKSHFEGGRDSVANKICREFLRQFLHALPLHKGFGHKRPKIHLQLHWAFWIIMFGCAKNFDSARCECIAGENVKKHSQKTQKRAISLNLQTATRINEETIFSDLRKLTDIDDDLDDEDVPPNIMEDADAFDLTNDTHSHGIKGGSRFTITFEPETRIAKLKWARKNTPGQFNPLILSTISRRLHSFVRENFPHTHNPDTGRTIIELYSIDGFTELKKGLDPDSSKLSTFRSIPSFRDGRPWNDWANFRWDIDGVDTDLEGRIEMFLDFSSLKINKYSDHDIVGPPNSWENRVITSIPLDAIKNKPGYTGQFVCVTTSVNENEANVRVRACMRSNISTLKRCKEELCYISTEHLFDKAFVVPNSYYDEPSILPREIMVYNPIHTWAQSITDIGAPIEEEGTDDEISVTGVYV